MSGAKGGWPETRDAIARNLVYLGDDWTSHYSPIGSIQKQARYLGVLLVLIAFVLAPSFRSILPAHFTKRLTIIDGASLWLLVVGWFFVAAGAFSVLSDFADVSVNPLSPHAVRDVIVNVGFGVVAAVACGFISRATKFFSDGQTTAR